MKVIKGHELNIPHDLPGRHLSEKNGKEVLFEIISNTVFYLALFAMVIAFYLVGKLDSQPEIYNQGMGDAVNYYEATGQMPSKAWVEWRIDNLRINIASPDDVLDSLESFSK